MSGSGAVQPWYGGQQAWGMISNNITVNSTTASGIPTQLTYDPTTGNLVNQAAIGSGGYGPYLNAVQASTRTASGQTTTSLYQTNNSGSYTQTSSSPYSTGTFSASGLTGTMYLGGSGSIVSAPITAGFNLTGTGASGAFPASSSGAVTPNSFLGAVAGPASGTQNGWVTTSASYMPSGSSSSYNMGLSGLFTLGPASATPPYPGTLTVSSGNGTSPNGYPISVTGTWTQSDPPAGATQTAAATSAPTSWGPNSRPLAWAIQRAAALSSQGATPSNQTGANGPPWLNRFSRLTSAPLGSMIQQAAQLSRPGTPAVPGSGPDLHRLARRALPRIQGSKPTSMLNVVKR
jgi:hypothetical protein